MFIQVNQLRAAGVSSSSTMMATSAMTCSGMTTIRIFFSRSARNTCAAAAAGHLPSDCAVLGFYRLPLCADRVSALLVTGLPALVPADFCVQQHPERKTYLPNGVAMASLVYFHVVCVPPQQTPCTECSP